MAIENQKTAALIACSSTAPAPTSRRNGVVKLVAAFLSWWLRRNHPPDVPDDLRADVGLPPIYMMRNWHDAERDWSRSPAARRRDYY